MSQYQTGQYFMAHEVPENDPNSNLQKPGENLHHAMMAFSEDNPNRDVEKTCMRYQKTPPEGSGATGLQLHQ